jgi:HAD superfamily hydrolase (TIGR01484 family)
MINPLPDKVCLDFDGTIIRYEAPPEHFHPRIIDALNKLGDAGIVWIANSGRSFEGQLDIVQHSVRNYGLRQWPEAILSGESYVHIRDGADYRPLADWNQSVHEGLSGLQTQIWAQCKNELDDLINRYAPSGAHFREEALVFQVSGAEDNRNRFLAELRSILAAVPHAEIVHNGEWISVLHDSVGKGNVLRTYLAHQQWAGPSVLTVGDHGNDISMLNGSVTPYVGCPGDAFEPVRATVRKTGGHVANAAGPLGTLEVFHHYWPDLLGPFVEEIEPV